MQHYQVTPKSFVSPDVLDELCQINCAMMPLMSFLKPRSFYSKRSHGQLGTEPRVVLENYSANVTQCIRIIVLSYSTYTTNPQFVDLSIQIKVWKPFLRRDRSQVFEALQNTGFLSQLLFSANLVRRHHTQYIKE